MGRRFFIRRLDTHNKLTYIILMKRIKLKEKTTTIDVTPKWVAVVRILTEVLKSPRAGNADKQNATNELLNLAKILDDQNEKARVQKEILKELTHDS